MPLSPKRVIHRKVQRGRIHGNATRGNELDFGDVALVAMEPFWLTNRQLEAARVALNRYMNRPGQIIFEVGGVDRATAEGAMHLAGSKLPIKTKIAYSNDVQ